MRSTVNEEQQVREEIVKGIAAFGAHIPPDVAAASRIAYAILVLADAIRYSADTKGDR